MTTKVIFWNWSQFRYSKIILEFFPLPTTKNAWYKRLKTMPGWLIWFLVRSFNYDADAGDILIHSTNDCDGVKFESTL